MLLWMKNITPAQQYYIQRTRIISTYSRRRSTLFNVHTQTKNTRHISYYNIITRSAPAVQVSHTSQITYTIDF